MIFRAHQIGAPFCALLMLSARLVVLIFFSILDVPTHSASLRVGEADEAIQNLEAYSFFWIAAPLSGVRNDVGGCIRQKKQAKEEKENPCKTKRT